MIFIHLILYIAEANIVHYLLYFIVAWAMAGAWKSEHEKKIAILLLFDLCGFP